MTTNWPDTDSVVTFDITEPAAPRTVRTPAALDAASDVTRLLCAGVYLDDAFRERVISVLTDDPERYAAPAYGYDSARVVAHALSYRERRRSVRIGIGILALFTALMAVAGFEVFFITCLVAAWLAWVLVFFERLYVHNVLVRHFRRTAPTGSPAAAMPMPPGYSARTSQLSPEQSASAKLVYYSGYKPFIGAGQTTRHWAFPILLVPKRGESLAEVLSPDADTPPAEVRSPDIGVADLLSYVERRLGEVLRTELQDARRIDQLEITRRWYRTAVAESRPKQPDRVDLRELADRQGQEDYGSPREYLCVHIGSWKQELVTSAFLSFDVKGQTLHIEFHACELKPIKPSFHSVDFYPKRIGAGRVVRIAIGAVGHTIAAVLSGPFALIGVLGRLSGRRSGDDTDDRSADDSGGFRDYGARASVREVAAHTDYHHYFQDIDSDKYLSIVERWIDQITLEYLDSKGVDLAEFRRKRSVTLVNTGYLQTGGALNVDGGVAVGTGATVTITPQDAPPDPESGDETAAQDGETFFLES